VRLSVLFESSRTRRSWKPNTHRKRIFSEVLGRELKLVVASAAMRNFDKYGSMDRYLLRSPLHRLDLGITRELRTDMELKLLDSERKVKL
jgi:large subunit ribosomal protein L28